MILLVVGCSCLKSQRENNIWYELSSEEKVHSYPFINRLFVLNKLTQSNCYSNLLFSGLFLLRQPIFVHHFSISITCSNSVQIGFFNDSSNKSPSCFPFPLLLHANFALLFLYPKLKQQSETLATWYAGKMTMPLLVPLQPRQSNLSYNSSHISFLYTTMGKVSIILFLSTAISEFTICWLQRMQTVYRLWRLIDWKTACIVPAILSNPLMAVEVDLVTNENAARFFYLGIWLRDTKPQEVHDMGWTVFHGTYLFNFSWFQK